MPLMVSSGSSATDKYADFQPGLYTFEVISVAAEQSQKFTHPDGTPKTNALIGYRLPAYFDPEARKPYEDRMLLNLVTSPPNPKSQNEQGKKGSHLWNLIAVLTGYRCDWDEQYDIEQLIGRHGQAMFSRNESGYLRVNNSTFLTVPGAPATPGGPVDFAALAPAHRLAAPVAAPASADRQVAEMLAKPAPPRRPAAQAGPPTLTPDQMALIREAWEHGGFEGPLMDYITANYGGRGLAQVRADEYEELAKLVGAAPF